MTSLFRQEAIDNQRERLWGDVILIQPFSFYLITGAVTVLVIIAAVFLSYGTYARRENVLGYLLPDKGLVKVYAVQRGLVSNIHVVEGDQVNKGDLLFTISTQKTNAQSTDVDALILNKLKEDKVTIVNKMAEQKILNSHEEMQYKDQIAGLKKEIMHLKMHIKTHIRKYKVSKDHLDNLGQVFAKNYLSKADYIRVQEHHVDIQLRLGETRQQLGVKQNQLTQVTNLLGQLPLKASIKMAGFTQQLSDNEQRVVELEGRRIYTLRAPSAGKVTGIQVSLGNTVKDKPLLTILPRNAKFKAELFVPTRAVGFIKTGQSVLLRYNAFPYQRFGLYEGTIDKVTEVILSPDELHVPVKLEEPVYRVSVIPKKQTISAYGREFDLQAGMLLEASIILEGRSLGEWLLAPLYSLKGRI